MCGAGVRDTCVPWKLAISQPQNYVQWYLSRVGHGVPKNTTPPNVSSYPGEKGSGNKTDLLVPEMRIHAHAHRLKRTSPHNAVICGIPSLCPPERPSFSYCYIQLYDSTELLSQSEKYYMFFNLLIGYLYTLDYSPHEGRVCLLTSAVS